MIEKIRRVTDIVNGLVAGKTAYMGGEDCVTFVTRVTWNTSEIVSHIPYTRVMAEPEWKMAREIIEHVMYVYSASSGAAGPEGGCRE